MVQTSIVTSFDLILKLIIISCVLLGLEVVLLYYVVIHYLLLFECILILIFSYVFVYYGASHVPEGGVSSEVQNLHNDEDADDVAKLCEGK